MKVAVVEKVLREIQEKTLEYIMRMVRPEELIDVNLSLSFEGETLNIDVQVSLHEASTKNPVEIARKAAQHAMEVFEEVRGKYCDAHSNDKSDKTS